MQFVIDGAIRAALVAAQATYSVRLLKAFQAIAQNALSDVAQCFQLSWI
jgi:hypothetical protein